MGMGLRVLSLWAILERQPPSLLAALPPQSSPSISFPPTEWSA